MKTIVMSAVCALVLSAGCNKKEPQVAPTGPVPAVSAGPAECGREIITDKPVKAGETGLLLPAGTRICIRQDNLEVRVELPRGYAFLTADVAAKALPIFATYTCICSAAGSACQVFYADGAGFGCLQRSCTGACTGKFTYQGYAVDKVISTDSKSEFFILPEIARRVEEQCKSAGSTAGDFVKLSVFGVSFFMVTNEAKFLAVASCNCDGTQACRLKTLGISGYKIYFCEGACNGCELTVS